RAVDGREHELDERPALLRRLRSGVGRGLACLELAIDALERLRARASHGAAPPEQLDRGVDASERPGGQPGRADVRGADRMRCNGAGALEPRAGNTVHGRGALPYGEIDEIDRRAAL